MEKAVKRKSLKFDLILIFSLLAIGIVSLFIYLNVREGGGAVRVEVSGETVGEYPLSVDARYSLNGGTNVLVIKDGYAYIEEADCPDGICVRMGKISYVGESVTCLPNKVFVWVVE